MITANHTMDRARNQDGWSMIEVVITILVIALVAAYAIPKLLGPRDSANDGTARTTLRAAETALETLYAQQQSYNSPTALNAATFQTLEPSVTYVAGNALPFGNSSANAKQVYGVAVAAEDVTLCSASKSTRVFCLRLRPNLPTVFYSSAKLPVATVPATFVTTVQTATADPSNLGTGASLDTWQ